MDEGQILQNMKKGLVGWYPFRTGSEILYIGNMDEGWIPEHRDSDIHIEYCPTERLKRMAGESENKYDYVLAVEKLELAEKPIEILDEIKRLMTDDGTLLLGMNNRLGIRYFCGDRDKYTGRNFDGIENYRRVYAKKEDTFQGRMYAESEIREMLAASGLGSCRMFAVFPDLYAPCMLIAENYRPNEDLSGRIFPVYEAPDLLFLEEEYLYKSMLDNKIFHSMANAFLFECSKSVENTNVMQVTSSLERNEKDAFYTVISGEGLKPTKVKKIPAFTEARKRLLELKQNSEYLVGRGIKAVPIQEDSDSCSMPYIDGETGQLHLKNLLLSGNIDDFYNEMDKFRDLIMKSSEIVTTERDNDRGAVLRKGFWDLVPLNSIYADGDFVFFDQEFVQENLPANVLIFRMVATFFHASPECEKLLSRDVLYDRYGLTAHLSEWQKEEGEFLAKLRNEEPLGNYHRKHWRNSETVHANRQRMNYPLEEYEKKFVHIFENADTRKLVLFGSGRFAEHFISIYGRDYEIYAVVDNNSDRWGKEVQGIMIQSPEILLQLESGEYKVIICIKNYISVMKQLDEMGVGDYAVYDISRSYPRRLTPTVAEEPSDKKKKKKKYHIGYVSGAFDMFHAGHLNLLRKAKEQCDYLIVGVLSDESIYKLKNKYPVIPLNDRVDIVASCRYVDYAEGLMENYCGIKEAYRMFHFDVQFSGDDHVENTAWQADKEFLRRNGADLVFFPYTEKVSSTKLKAQLEQRQKEKSGEK